MPLSHICRILNGAFRFYRAIECIKIFMKYSPFDLPQTPMMLSRIFRRSPLGSLNLTVITPLMNGRDLLSFIK